MKWRLFWCVTLLTAALLLDSLSWAEDVPQPATINAELPSPHNSTDRAVTTSNATTTKDSTDAVKDEDGDEDEDDYDDEDDKDLSPSLADYIMNLMRGKSDNSSKAQNNSSDNATVGTHSNGGNDSQTISTQQHSQVRN